MVNLDLRFQSSSYLVRINGERRRFSIWLLGSKSIVFENSR
jgi:hypothetical protein